MAKLFTHHDHNNAHKSLGLVVLLQFVYRFVNLALCGSCFPDSEPLWASTLLLLAHACLSVSSLIFRLPAKRNFTSPMIWPEFGLHSIVFATRHVCVTFVPFPRVAVGLSGGGTHRSSGPCLPCGGRGGWVFRNCGPGDAEVGRQQEEDHQHNALPRFYDRRPAEHVQEVLRAVPVRGGCDVRAPLAQLGVHATSGDPDSSFHDDTCSERAGESDAAYHGVYSVSTWLAVLLAPSAAQFRVPIIFSVWLCRICMHHARTVHSCEAKWVQLCGVSLVSRCFGRGPIAPTFLINDWWDRALLLANCAYVVFRISQFCRCIS